MSFPELIYDRTAADAAQLRALAEKLKDLTATAEDWAAYNAAHRGGYNFEDLNRVETAVAYLRDVFAALGYPLLLQIKTDWTGADWPDEMDLARYLQNVGTIREVLAVWETTPPLPVGMNKLTTDAANAIERILTDVELLTQNIRAAWFTSNDIYSGEV